MADSFNDRLCDATLRFVSFLATSLRLPVLATSIAGGFAALMLYLRQNDLIYPRFLPMNARTDVPSPGDFGIPAHAFDHTSITTPDNEKLDVMVLRPSNCQAAQARKPQRLRSEFTGFREQLNDDGDSGGGGYGGGDGETDGAPKQIFTKKSNQFLRGPDGAASSSASSAAPSSRYRSNKTMSGRWRDPRITMLMFHGNAGNIGHRVPIARSLVHTLNCNVVMLEYRGYGLSTGKPDERGLKIDAQTGLDWILSQEEFVDTQVVLYGQSLGGAVAISLAEKNQDIIAALVLENTFLSVRKMVPRVLPAARYVSWLCHQIWDSESHIPKVTDMPVLFLSGMVDEIVPPEHMTHLFNTCGSEVKMFRVFPNGTHNDTCTEPDYFEHIYAFMNSVLEKGT